MQQKSVYLGFSLPVIKKPANIRASSFSKWLQSADRYTKRWECPDMKLLEYKRFRRDGIYTKYEEGKFV